MSVDKLVDSTQLDSDLTSVANAIRAKSGGSSQLAFPAGFVSEIQAIPSGGGSTVYTSSTGLLYTPIMTFDCSLGSASGNTLNYIFSALGEMPYLEELTLTGKVKYVNSANILTTEAAFPVSRFPLLKKLHIQPTEIYSGNTLATNQLFKFSHYPASYSNLTELTLGKLGGPYWDGGGYYRKYDENGNINYTIGSTSGLTLSAYVASYRANGGFSSGSVAANTTIIEYDYTNGEVVTE